MTEQNAIVDTMRQLMRFGIIGVLAALTHYAIVMILTNTGIQPAWANLIAFVIAFWVSYFGHRYFSFAAREVSHQQTLPRFIIVAVVADATLYIGNDRDRFTFYYSIDGNFYFRAKSSVCI
jgi:putative flippase GtrA